MFVRLLKLFTSLTLLFGLVSSAYGSTIYNEALLGDLSNSGLSPTFVMVGVGSNQIIGTTGRSTGIDRDYFTITVPKGFELTSLTVLPGTAVGGASTFIGVESGNQVTLPTNAATAAGLLGWRHYGAADINTDILPEMGTAGMGSSGFIPPLAAGDYAFWIQEFSGGSFAYDFDLNIQSVPEPATLTMMLAGLVVIATLGRKTA